MRRWKKILAPVLVFALGVLFGIGGTGLFVVRKVRQIAQADTAESVRAGARLFARRLDLDAEQRAAARVIFEDLAAGLAQLRADSTPRMRQIFLDAETRLRPLLDPEQQEKLDALLKEPKARWERIAPNTGLQPDAVKNAP